LFMMNSPFVLEAARRIADAAANADSDTESRIRRLYRTILTRPPTDAEVDRASRFVDQFQNDAQSASEPDQPWRLLAQALLSTNEFIYVR